MNAHLKQGLAAVMIPALLLTTMTQAAAPTGLSSTPIQAIPPNVLTAQPRPLVMLNMSKDHQLFYRAYNEFSDYNGDGQPDGTYLHTLRYSGYFDSTKCYTYSTADRRFNPSSVLASRTSLCTDAWHGNFLNWATMTRMDILRKVLYGGTRSTDTATQTVLERASLPMDAHSFAKYYANGPSPTADRPNLSGLTPFSRTEISICNTTLGSNTSISHTNTNPPLMRVAEGNFSLWNSHERRQCRWDEENNIWDQDGQPNGNDPARTGIQAASDYPSRLNAGLPRATAANPDRPDYVVRVAVCVAGLRGAERCRDYPTPDASKPIGLLQEYGEADLAEFGLMTGSFSRNTSGGVLRKNASSFRNEVNYLTNGTFTRNAGIVTNIDALKVYGYRYSDSTYSARDNGDAADSFCAFQTIGLVDNQCASWGNPIGEMFIETLRYLRGGALRPAADYGSGADAKGELMGLTVAAWVDPFTRGSAIDNTFGAPACRPINTVNFNASVISYDGDTTGPFTDLGAASSLATYINQVGSGEGVPGTSRFVGNTPTEQNAACTAKTLTNLSDAVGLCPAAPAYRGTYSLAGAAYWANTNPIRTVPATVTGTSAQRAFRVRSYGVALAPGVPRITVTTSTGAQAVIQPAYRLTLNGQSGSGTLVDFRVIEQTATRGRYIVLWEDSEQGGDYDQDFNGLLEWELSGNTLTVTTRRIADSTGGGGQGFGYTISGTNRDGVHFHTGILGFSYTDPTNLPVTNEAGVALNGTGFINASGGCNNCTSGNNVPTRARYTVLGNPGSALEDPMWYAAKWGGFRNSQGVASGTPSDAATWDAVNNATGASGPDGVPDNYSIVFNPEQLEASLRRVFDDAVGTSNSSPSVSSSQLVGGSFKYVASFDNDRLSGDVEAFAVNNTRNFNTTASWSAAAQLSAVPAANRQVISNDGVNGFAFTWANIETAARAAWRGLFLGGSPALTSAEGQQVVAFMRGDRSAEGTGDIRIRPASNVLGPVVNASPWLQGPPSARYTDALHPGYSTFANLAANRSRTPLLWVGAGDGMLHAFNGDTGVPVLSFVPEALAPRLREVVRDDLGVRAFADGSPFSGDVDLNAGVSGASTRDWRTYVFAPLGRGGRAIYALDATTPSNLTQANAASVFRWSFNADDDADLGHVVSDISVEPGTGQASPVVKLENGRYAVVFGNGVRSTNGRAVLFILPVQGPDATGNWAGRYYKITLDTGSGNGLSTPVILDLDNDGRADTVYAGDLRGNLWKVDISDPDPSNWRSAYVTGANVPTPLYVVTASDGTTRLPITGSPQVAFPRFGGQVVTVASGLALETGDFPRAGVAQRVVGIWDRPSFASGGRSLPRGTTTLVQRTVSRTASGELVASSSTGIDYQNATASLARDGWYFEPPGSSEMVLSNIGFRAGAVFFTSIRSPASVGTVCSPQPDAALYVFDPISGLASRGLLGTVDVNVVQTAVLARNVSDQKVRDVADATDDTPPPAVNPPGGQTRLPSCPGGGAATRYVGRTTDVITCTPQSNARLQWREIPGLRTGN